MDDKFLYQLREQPDLEFTKNLHLKLTDLIPDPKQRLNWRSPTFTVTHKTRLVLTAALIAISVLFLATISPVRAFVSSLITNISGQTFEMTNDYPGDDHPCHKAVIEPQILPLAEALATFPHNIQLPSYVPVGYILDEENVRVYTGEEAGFLADTIELTWLSDGKGITLIIANRDLSVAEIVAPNSVEEITLDSSHAAAVIRGGWDADKKVWVGGSKLIRLRWLAGDLTYELTGRDLGQLTEIALSTLE